MISSESRDVSVRWRSTFRNIRTFSSGATTREADLLSYLLFDTSFTKPLADLGHADAMAKEEELVEFFTD